MNSTDFDEKCSQEDDWDVDMSVYYEQGIGPAGVISFQEFNSSQLHRNLHEPMHALWVLGLYRLMAAIISFLEPLIGSD